jgi:glyoxylate/hydroxypyruvate reductase
LKIVIAGMIEPVELEKYASYLRKALGSGYEIFSINSQTRIIQGFDLAQMDVAVVANPPAGFLARVPNAKLVQSLWAGVEPLVNDPHLPKHIPLARMVDSRMTQAMIETICLHVLMVHRQIPAYQRQQREKRWIQLDQPAPKSRTVGLCGYGQLGAAAARMLRAFGFNVIALRRGDQNETTDNGVEIVSGPGGFQKLVTHADMVINLMPLTPETKGFFSQSAFELMKPGATFINLGRGGHVVEADLEEALKEHLGFAVLDVFSTEPLTESHWAWEHEKVLLTPHVAAYTNASTAAKVVAENIQRLREGKPLLHLVDRERGY